MASILFRLLDNNNLFLRLDFDIVLVSSTSSMSIRPDISILGSQVVYFSLASYLKLRYKSIEMNLTPICPRVSSSSIDPDTRGQAGYTEYVATNGRGQLLSILPHFLEGIQANGTI